MARDIQKMSFGMKGAGLDVVVRRHWLARYHIRCKITHNCLDIPYFHSQKQKNEIPTTSPINRITAMAIIEFWATVERPDHHEPRLSSSS